VSRGHRSIDFSQMLLGDIKWHNKKYRLDNLDWLPGASFILCLVGFNHKIISKICPSKLAIHLLL
jgi:hypothetical protein